MTIALTILLGTLIGLIVGIFPGMGTSFIFLVFYSFLMDLPTDYLLVLYASIAMSSQFSGSVSALAYGVFGEVTSMPALQERPRLQKSKVIYNAIKNTSYSSLTSLPIAFLLVAVLYSLIPGFIYVLRTEVTVMFYLFMVLVSALWTNNKYYINIFLIVIGLFLGAIGAVTPSGQTLLTFSNASLTTGVPIIALLVGLVAVPGTLTFLDTKTYTNNSPADQRVIKFNIVSAIRGGFIGSLIGLIPAIGNTICSNVAWRVEKLFYKKDNASSSMNRVVSAEAANNGSSISVMLPLLMFGLPIVSSEIILYSMLEAKGWSSLQVNMNTLLLLFTTFTATALICWIFCGIAIQTLITYIKRFASYIAILATIFAIFGVIASGFESYNTQFYAIILTLSSLVGIIFRKVDFTPLVLTFLISSKLVIGLSTISQLYF